MLHLILTEEFLSELQQKISFYKEEFFLLEDKKESHEPIFNQRRKYNSKNKGEKKRFEGELILNFWKRENRCI